MREPDAYECDFCGAQFEPGEFYEYCDRDDDGNWEFKCSCGSRDYTELYQCKMCHGLYSPYKHKRLRWWRVCDDCCGAVINEFNSALDGIVEDYRRVLEQIYDIKRIEEV